jgi:hypothetical protein
VPSHANIDSGLMPSNYTATEGSVAGGESVVNEGGHLQQQLHHEEPSRVSSGTSVTTGQRPQSYVGSEEQRTVAA